MNLQATLRPAPDAIFRRLKEGGVVLHGRTGQYHGLNEFGARIWELLDEGRYSYRSLVEDMRRHMDHAPPTLEGDIVNFLEDLVDRGLVQVGEEEDFAEPEQGPPTKSK